MSCKGILPQTRNGSGQIEDECKKKLSDSLGFLKNGEYSLAAASSVLPDSNQDVAEECGNGENITSGVLEIASSANFILSSSEVTSDVVGVSVDDWFKHKSDGSMDLDSVLTTDGIEVNDLEAYHFAASKDNVDMCIVTNICDMGLGFDLPVNICDKSNQPLSECDSDERVVNEFEQTSFLDDFSKCDREKSMLIKVNNPKFSEKCDILSVKDKNINDSYILEFPDKEKDPNAKDSEWSQSDDVYGHSHPVVLNGEKVNWETLSTVSQHSTDYESEKDVDFSEFSLLTFQVENSEGINVINTLSQVDCASDSEGVPGNVIVSDRCVLSDSVSLVNSSSSEKKVVNTPKTPTVGVSKQICFKQKVRTVTDIDHSVLDTRTEPCVEVESLPSKKVETKTNYSSSIKKIDTTRLAPSSHPRSLLRPSRKASASKSSMTSVSLGENLSRTCSAASTQVQNEQESGGQQGASKRAPAMTIIAISTDKSKNTTEIVINTSQGEQKFKGKTSDFIKATSKLLNSQTVKTKVGQSLNLSNSAEVCREELSDAQTDSEAEWLRYERTKAADEQPITEALATLGIDMSSLACVTTRGRSGYKRWACPTPECNKLYPRLSLLKVHILTHYGVRPYRCDVPGCHWTFYTFFKLKRHKETHLKRKAFVCPVPTCGHRFTTVYNLKTHRKLHERPAKLQCPVVGCDAHFQTKRAVELHVKKHGISHAPYQCTFAGCGKRYYSSNTLNSHARSHQHREEEVRCQWPDCGKWFEKPCRLKAHMRTHTGDKPYLCTFQNCGWAFSSASKLKRHQQKHTNERKFRCSFEGCGKSFMRSEHLKEHTQTHIGERCYQCTVENCGVKFSAKSSLYVHLKKHKQQLKDAGIAPDGRPIVQLQSADTSRFLQKSKEGTSKLLVPKWEPVDSEESVHVLMPGGSNAFHCPVESCLKSYSCKASLRQHLLKHHTPVLASDASHLDYVTSLLLSGSSNQHVLVTASDEQMVTSDGLTAVSLQGPVCTVAVTGTGSLNSTGLLTSSSLLDATTYGSEYVNTDLLSSPHINNMLVVAQHESGGEGGLAHGATVLLTSDASNGATVPDADTELHLATESITDRLLEDDFHNPRVVAFDLDELDESETDEIVDDPTCQAARTNLTYHDVVLKKRLQYANSDASASADSKTINSSCDTSNGATIGSNNMGTNGSDSAVTETIAGLWDPVTALRLPPDMAGFLTPASELNLLLQEDSGLQVLLLDGTESQSYAESTINLRDLE